MKNFPKKYKPQELKTRSKQYINLIQTSKDKKSVFYPSFLPVSKKLTYQDFYILYLKDFFSRREIVQKSQHLFLFSNENLKNFSDTYSFFSKKNQTLVQT